MKLIDAQKALRRYATHSKAQSSNRFFKTGPGEYSEGDLFIGVSAQNLREIARQYQDLSSLNIQRLLESSIHEDRALGASILVRQYENTSTVSQKKKIFQTYLKFRKGVNNWDLVDMSAAAILGDFAFQTQNDQWIWKLARSKRHWDKRMAMVSTLALIRKNQLDLTFQLAQYFLGEEEDLMHKATGWMLRETGKRDVKRLKSFIRRWGSQMPRTMLRYAIERFPAPERKKILLQTR